MLCSLTKSFCITCLMALPVLAFSAETLPTCKFSDFVVKDAHQTIKARIKLDRKSAAWKFRTVIRESYQNTSVNYAGHYVAISWGCGSPCQQWAFVDAKTGLVYFDSKFSTENGAEFKSESSLFIANPASSASDYDISETCSSDDYFCKLDRGEFKQCYVWNENKLKSLQTPATQNHP